MQLKASEYAWREEFCYGAMCTQLISSTASMVSELVSSRLRPKKGKKGE